MNSNVTDNTLFSDKDLEFNPWTNVFSPFDNISNETNNGSIQESDSTNSDDVFAIDSHDDAEPSDSISENIHFTPARCTLHIGQQPVTAVIDSGAYVSVIAKSLLNQLGYVPTGPSNATLILANGAREMPIGIVSDLPVKVNNVVIHTTAHVIDCGNKYFILGNDWLRQLHASIDYGEECLTFYHQEETIMVPLRFTRECKPKKSKRPKVKEKVTIEPLSNSIESETEESAESQDSDVETITDEEAQPIPTLPYTYSSQEIHDIFAANIKIKQVIAGQPITKGESKCTFNCDVENHHIHVYCEACKQNLPYGTVVHDCAVGFSPGKIKPEMDPKYLVTEPWWTEPLVVQQKNMLHYLQCLKQLCDGLSIVAPPASSLELATPELD
jgi:predicted aspartyl protease